MVPQPDTAARPESTEWVTPCGSLGIAEDGGIRAVVRNSIRSQEIVARAIDTIIEIKTAPFLANPRPQRESEGYILKWPAPPGASLVPLSRLVTEWRNDPAAHLPRALDVADCLSRAVSELDHFRSLRFVLSPAQVFLQQGPCEQWVVVPLPLEGVGLRDSQWLRAIAWRFFRATSWFARQPAIAATCLRLPCIIAWSATCSRPASTEASNCTDYCSTEPATPN